MVGMAGIIAIRGIIGDKIFAAVLTRFICQSPPFFYCPRLSFIFLFLKNIVLLFLAVRKSNKKNSRTEKCGDKLLAHSPKFLVDYRREIS
jgi:hypothetical protein